VLAAPTPANRGLLNGDLLRRISPDAMLVLVSRAHLVDFEALTELLCAGRFRAAIDVFPEEPLPADHPIRHASGTLLSAHRAGGDVHGYRDIGRIVVNDLEAILAGLPPREMQRYLSM
jgi:phosphoglycerate dehydrogenase-like enzyme